jgi:riboflavin biosynthesis pyrimidine reductase
MGKIVISENVTLDGVVQDPAGAEGFGRGGWVGRVGDRGREGAAKVLLDEALGAEAQLFGRAGDVMQEVSKLKEELDGEIVIAGSIRLVRKLVENDLVDELRLMIYPVVLGAGERLFGETSDQRPVRLVETRTVDDLAYLTYDSV